MPTSRVSDVIQQLRRAALLKDGAGMTDGQLLECVIRQRDDAAFAALVRRHSPMVWGVCRRILHSYHDAEDAFQAFFLVLVRKAASIVPREMVANWLYGVAHQTALKARATAAKRKVRERQVTEMPEPEAAQQDVWDSLQPLLDQELNRLPDKYRVAIVLCDLEGKTRKEAARQLDVPEGTLSGRLTRGRTLLAKRLARHGLAVSGGALAAFLSQNVAAAGVPNSIVDSTIQAASLLAAGKAAATGAVSVKVAALTEGVMKSMLFTKLRAVIAVALILGFAGTGATILTCRNAAGQDDKKPTADKPVATAAKQDKPAPPKPDAVSPRLKGTLSHSVKGATLVSLQYSPDGKRLIAGDYPGGVIQVWDVATGKELAKIESGKIYRSGTPYFFVTPDWKTVYVPRQKVDITRFEKDGKRLTRREFDSDVSVWDLNTGELRETFKHLPPRGIESMIFSPDGLSFVTLDQLPGVGEGEGESVRQFATTLWDVNRKTHRDLPILGFGIFSPDGKMITSAKGDKDGYVKEIILVDVATAKETVTIPITENRALAFPWMFTTDGKVLIGYVRAYAEKLLGDDYQDQIIFWDAGNGKELASFAAEEKKTAYLGPILSPDGKLLAVTVASRQSDRGKIYFFDVATRKMAKTITLTESLRELRPPLFSPDGRWLAVPTQQQRDDEEIPKPRIHFVEVAMGVVRETLNAPEGFTASSCFSPDGKTLATGGHGKVLLWDLTTPPGRRAR